MAIAADFDGDNKADLAVANRDGNSVTVLRGNGLGGFASPVEYPVGATPVSIVIEDVNGDGKLDIATANFGSSNVSVLFGNGLGEFSAY